MLKIKNIIWRSLFIVVTAIIAACSNMTVQTDWDTSIDFSEFKTFALLDDAYPINRLTDERIRAALVSTLTARGLKQVSEVEKADLAIGQTVTTESRTSYQTVHSGMGASHNFRHTNMHFRGSVGTSQTRQHNYTVGSLVVTAYKTSSKILIWEGSASGIINPSSGPEASKELINDAVQRILGEFPPGVASASSGAY